MATIITVDEYKQFIGSSSTKEDDRIAEILTPVTNIIEGYLGYTVTTGAGANATTQITTKDRYSYFIDYSANFSLTSIKYKDRNKNVFDIDLEDVIVAPNGRIDILFPPVKFEDNGILTIEYSAEDSVTEDIKLAAKLLTRYYFKDEYNVQSVTATGASVTFISGKNLPPHVRTILDLHRNL